MAATKEITIALDRYDRHFPFFDGTVKAPDGFSYRALQVGQSDHLRDGTDRHGQMIKHQAFDVSEFSMSTFLMAIDRGLPLIGIPVFPRRLFSQSCMFVRADSDIEHPRSHRTACWIILVPDNLVAARQGRSQIRIWRRMGAHQMVDDHG
jgi:4,5-dihydroxyphthalate decarboxylase